MKGSKVLNLMVFGTVGAGKTMFVKKAIEEMVEREEKDVDVYVISNTDEYQVGKSTWVRPGVDETSYLNPLYSQNSTEFLTTLLEVIAKKSCTPMELSWIHRAVKHLKNRQKDEITLEDFYDALLFCKTVETNELALLFEPYCIGNINIFAHKTNHIFSDETNPKVFLLDEVPNRFKEFAILCTIECILQQIPKGRDSVIVIDDIVPGGERFITALLDYFKNSIRDNIRFVGICQDFERLIETANGRKIIEGSECVFLNQVSTQAKKIFEYFGGDDVVQDFGFFMNQDIGNGYLYHTNFGFKYGFKRVETKKLSEVKRPELDQMIERISRMK